MLSVPAEWYSDQEVFDRERTAVWSAEWVVFATGEALAARGDYVAGEIAGYPIFVAVGPDGRLRGFHNVCPHRAGVIVWPGAGTTANLVCRYHGWAFGWDGALRSARDFGGDPGLCHPEHALVSIHVEEWRNLVFVHLGEAPPPLADAIAPFDAECRSYPIDRFRHVRRMVRELACNWKTYVDNYLEGYHVPLLHPGLNRALDMSTYVVEVPHASYCVHRAEPIDGSPSGGAWLFRYPNLAVNVYQGGMNVERIVPVDRRRTQVVYDYFATPGADVDDARGEALDAMVEMSNVVLDEDQAMCEAVQRNLDAGVYRPGPLSPRHEGAVGWFQARIAASVG